MPTRPVGDHQEILKRYARGDMVKNIADDFQCTAYTIRRIVKKYGQPLRKHGQPVKELVSPER